MAAAQSCISTVPVLIVSCLYTVEWLLQGSIAVFFIIHLLHLQAVGLYNKG